MKKLRVSRTKKPKRNPHARALRTALFRPKAVPARGAYRRKAKHQRREDETADE